MDDNAAFTAGVRFGGLSDKTEIKILICYLLSSIQQPIPHEILSDTIVGQGLVNYFELQNALIHLVQQNILIDINQCYSITQDGIEISTQLEKGLPFSVKERAYKSAIELLKFKALKEQNKTKITPLDKGGFNLNCTISDGDLTIFSFDIFMPDKKSATLAQDKFIKYGQDIFKCVLGITTENPKLYKGFLSDKI